MKAANTQIQLLQASSVKAFRGFLLEATSVGTAMLETYLHGLFSSASILHT